MEDFNAWVEELLAKTDLIQVISRYVPLKRKGGNHWGCCPFHHEKEPSFAVNEQKQFYHCFGCKESGNAITFIQKMENIDRIDAIRILAREAGMELPKLRRNTEETVTREKKDRLLALMKSAARHYYDNLSDPRAKAAREYLARREIPDNLVKKFGLGFSVGWDEMIVYLKGKGYTHAEMKEAGIAAQKGDSWYDVYYNRLMFPIINSFGEIIAFGGRTLESDPEFAKYRNTSQTPIFDKSKAVYAVNLLKKKKQREGLKYIIMTEGYMDVIALHKAGFDSAVASMGTALTWPQAKQLKNYCDRIYISYDGDTAGQKATMRGLDILAQAGMSIRVVRLPEGLDPDDVIKKQGAQGYQKLLDEAVTLPAFKIETLKNSYDLNDTEEKSKFAVEAVRVITALENPVERQDYLKLLNTYTGYPMEVLYAQAGIGAPPEEPQTETKVEAPETAADDGELFVLASLVHGADYVDYAQDLFPYLDELGQAVYGYVIERVRSGVYKSPTGLFTALDPKFEAEVGAIVNYRFIEGDGKKKYDDCVKNLQIRSLDKRQKDILERLRSTRDKSLLEQLDEVNKQLNRIKNRKE